MPRGRPKKITTPAIEEIKTVKEAVETPTIEEKKFNTKKLLLVIDMQNDFISGALANTAAEKIVKPMCEFIKNYDGEIIFTQDTHHNEDYLESFEGRKLPVKHCIINTPGWEVDKRLLNAATEAGHPIKTALKFYFGGGEALKKRIENELPDAPVQIDMVGTCTDICVVSNALQLRTLYPDTEINVWGNLCAGLTTKKHNAALEVMSSCQINIMTYENNV